LQILIEEDLTMNTTMKSFQIVYTSIR